MPASNPSRLSWTEVRDQIKAQILDRVYAPGDKLPRDEDIAASIGCARSTVQRAMQDLSDRGIIVRKRKGGTQVRPDPVSQATLQIPITRLEIEAQGGVYGHQLISRELKQTPQAVMQQFALSAPTEMLHVQAVHLSDQRPYAYEDRWISTETAAEILEVDLSKISANEWLVQHHPYSRGDLRFYANQADAELANVLQVARNEALLVIARTTWIDDAPITTVRTIMQPGYQLHTRF